LSAEKEKIMINELEDGVNISQTQRKNSFLSQDSSTTTQQELNFEPLNA